MAISTIAKIERLHNVHSGSPQTTKRNPPQITKFYSMIFKQQLTDISTVLNNTGNATKLLTSFNALDIAQQKVLLSSSLLSEKQKEQCITMATLSAANTKYTAEQLVKATGISTETLANWGLIESTDALTISELAQRAASDAQAKAVLDKIIAQNAEAVANGKIIASNTALATSEGGATLATGAFTTAIKANIKAMITWMTTTPLGWLTMLVGGVFLAVKAYDALTVSVKEQKEKMEDSLSVYKDAKSELSNITTELENQEQAMDDLLAKEKLTYAEQGQLEELQAITRELRIQKDLAEKEEGRTQKEVAKDASDLFNKQFGKYDISENAINEYQNNANITGNNAILVSDEDNISSMIAGYRQFNDLLDEAYGSESQEDIDHFKSLTDDLKDSIFETAQDLQEQQSNIADYYNTIKDIPYDDLTTEQKGIVDSYNSISDAIELIYQQLDSNTWKSMQIENVFDTEGIEKTKEELIEMVKAGEFDESTLQSYPKLSAALDQNKVSASELRNELEALADAEGNVKGDTFNDKYPISSLSISDTIDQLNTQLKPAFDSLKSAFQSIFTSDGYNPNAVDIPMLESIKSSIEEINELEDVDITIDMDAFDSLATTLTDINTTEGQAKQAFNDFATSIFYATNATDGMTEETKELVEQLLESLGIVNATEVAEYALAEAKAKDMLATYDVINAKESEYVAILAEGEAAGIARQQLYKLMAAEIAFGNNDLNTEQKIEQLRNLAKAYGDTASAALATAIANDLASGHTDVDSAINDLMAQVNSGIQKVDIDFSPIEKSAAKAGSSAGKSYADALKDGLSNLNSVINYIGDTIDKQIDLFEDQKDAAVDALEAEKEAAEEALEAEKELVQEKIDAKQAEIDAIEEAAKARKNELDLQQKQYELERMQNQKTMLVNYMPDTIVI